MKVQIKTREQFRDSAWQKILTAFVKAIDQAGQKTKKHGGSFSLHLVALLEKNQQLNKLLREKPHLGLKVAATLGCGSKTIIEYISKLCPQKSGDNQ